MEFWYYGFGKKKSNIKSLEIKEINEKCNNYIHKNGFTKISPKYINENNDTELLENWYKIIKFYFTITASYDGKSIASSDCMDYIENEEEPSEECQHWIASTFQDFIDAEYINEEKNKIINQSYMDIKQKNWTMCKLYYSLFSSIIFG